MRDDRTYTTTPYMQQSRHDDGRMTREEAMYLLNNLRSVAEGKEDKAIDMAIEALSADAVPIVYCMDCAKSVPLDEHGALWKCKAHDRTTLRHSYCNNGERKGGDTDDMAIEALHREEAEEKGYCHRIMGERREP